MNTLDRVRLALQDPDVLALMRQDPEFAEYFDAEGNLVVDPARPDSRWQRFQQQFAFRFHLAKMRVS